MDEHSATNPSDAASPIAPTALSPQMPAADVPFDAPPREILDPLEAASAPAGSRLGFPVGCVRCGYNLQGLTVPNRCPECGSDVSHSLDGRLLRFQPLGALRLMRRGAILVGCALVFRAVAPVLWMGLSQLGYWDAMYTLWAVPVLLSMFGWVLWLAGWLCLTTRPIAPAPIAEPAPRSRRIARLLALIAAGVVVGTALGGLSLSLFQDPEGRFLYEIDGLRLWAALAIEWLGTLLLLVQFYASLVYIYMLGRRLPDRRIPRASLVVGVGMSAALILGGAALVGIGRLSQSPLGLGYALGPAALILGFGCMLLYLLLLSRLSVRLKAVLKEAVLMRRPMLLKAAPARPHSSSPTTPPAAP